METRQMEASILFVKDELESGFEKIRIALENNIRNNKGDWIHRINNFIKTVNLTWTEIRNKNRQKIRDIIRKHDTVVWEEGMENKSSLYMYKEEKKKMGYEECYNNTYQSELLAKARTNSMQLADWYARGTKGKGDATCPICKHAKEDIIHFLIECKKLDNYRNKEIIALLPKRKPREVKVKNLLFRIKRWKEIAEMILNMWNGRKKEIEKETDSNK